MDKCRSICCCFLIYVKKLLWVSLKEFPSLGNQVRSRGGEGPRRRAWQPTPGFLPGEFHGQRGLAGYSPWSPEELDTTERLTLSLSFSSLPKPYQPAPPQPAGLASPVLSTGNHGTPARVPHLCPHPCLLPSASASHWALMVCRPPARGTYEKKVLLIAVGSWCVGLTISENNEPII